MTNTRHAWVGLVAGGLLLLLTASGCGLPRRLYGPERKDRGLVLVLPGIEGKSHWNRDIAMGLDAGGVSSAIQICDWTTGVPGNLVYNLAALERNKREADKIAKLIHAYRLVYPGRPIHLIGHSGGGGVAILTLEALPENQPIDAAFLLGPALSPRYDLTDALKRTQLGLYNFYSDNDSALLKVGTSLFGSIDRSRGPAAGAVGFETPDKWTAEARALYEARLRQVAWRPEMRAFGADGTHLGWTRRDFAREFLAPIIVQNEARRVVQRQRDVSQLDATPEPEYNFRPPPPLPDFGTAVDSP